jgi:hypothetical protein
MSIMVDVEPAIRSDTPSRQVLTGRAGVNAKRGLFTGQDFDRGHKRLAHGTRVKVGDRIVQFRDLSDRICTRPVVVAVVESVPIITGATRRGSGERA